MASSSSPGKERGALVSPRAALAARLRVCPRACPLTPAGRAAAHRAQSARGVGVGRWRDAVCSPALQKSAQVRDWTPRVLGVPPSYSTCSRAEAAQSAWSPPAAPTPAPTNSRRRDFWVHGDPCPFGDSALRWFNFLTIYLSFVFF